MYKSRCDSLAGKSKTTNRLSGERLAVLGIPSGNISSLRCESPSAEMSARSQRPVFCTNQQRISVPSFDHSMGIGALAVSLGTRSRGFVPSALITRSSYTFAEVSQAYAIRLPSGDGTEKDPCSSLASLFVTRRSLPLATSQSQRSNLS